MLRYRREYGFPSGMYLRGKRRKSRTGDLQEKIIKFQFIELNGRLMWCDFGANLVQHFMLAYSRYSRYRTRSHDTQTKRVDKLVCQQASADCSASVLRIAKQSAKHHIARGEARKEYNQNEASRQARLSASECRLLCERFAKSKTECVAPHR